MSDIAWNIPPTFNFAVDVVDAWSRDETLMALRTINEAGVMTEYTYAELADRSRRLVALMKANGVAQGDRVLVMMPRIAEWLISMLACARMGCVPIPCITMLTSADLVYRTKHSGARVVMTTATEVHKFDQIDGLEVRIAVGGAPGWVAFEAAAATEPDFDDAVVASSDPAILYYTSGSTGGPKGVLHAAAALYAWRVSAQHWLDLDRGDVIWCTADTGWSKAGTSILYGPLSRGATTVLYDGPFDVDRRLELIESLQVNVFCASATELRRIIAEAQLRKLPNLRCVVSAGESVNPEIVRQWRQVADVDVLDGYGQTETLMTVTNAPGQQIKLGSMGQAMPGTEIAVLTPDGVVEHRDSAGELLVRAPSPQLMLEYLGEPDRTDNCYLDDGDDRWFRTGDNVRIDDEGYVFYVGRADDIINSSGYRIGPQEVENALLTHDAVLESAVVGAPDPDRGEIVVAFVVLGDGVVGSDALVAELQDHVKVQTAPYKYPRRIVLVDELPKTVSGKLRRNELRRSLIEASGTSDSS
jgi:acyl-coenzyme A synthetase/AMP-(fatty) acid ligase